MSGVNETEIQEIHAISLNYQKYLKKQKQKKLLLVLLISIIVLIIGTFAAMPLA